MMQAAGIVVGEDCRLLPGRSAIERLDGLANGAAQHFTSNNWPVMRAW
jgi:hypothetical protein